jgi:cobalt-zinc-cadmium resistance protein CzcA
MLNNIIELSLKNRLVVVLLLAASLGLGLQAMLRIPVDAFPDTTPVQRC